MAPRSQPAARRLGALAPVSCEQPASASETDLAVIVEALPGLDLSGLRARWRSETGKAAPGHLSRSLLLRLLAYRVQADRRGDLDPDTVRFLDRIAAGRDLDGGAAVPFPDRERLRPGMELRRDWNGVTHRVTVLVGGFGWNRVVYASLSEVARAITGTRWNGPRFFGLRKDATR